MSSKYIFQPFKTYVPTLATFFRHNPFKCEEDAIKLVHDDVSIKLLFRYNLLFTFMKIYIWHHLHTLSLIRDNPQAFT